VAADARAPAPDAESERDPGPTNTLLTNDLPPPPRRAAVAEPPQLPKQLAGYELGDEIGRGGMGVVIRARDPRLDRTVALKLVIAGAYSGKEARESFLAEARVTARLRHPHIVQIYEVGEENGVPFMALELIEGGTLAREVAGHPLAPRRAAELIETLARAVGHAHSRGVIHRDLKPANVLLAADGPKVADFGVAVVLDPDTTARTGLLAGTPSYMAPEQTAGTKNVGPLADVYALGAILYECLTSRPPFKAATPLETLDLVRAQPPVPPADLQPGVPRDLNTICLKCLEKEPARRYASAEALADDIGRFLRGEPIIARPVGRVERLWRWVRRNPRDAVLVAALFAALAGGFAGVFWQWQRSEGRRIESEGRKVEAEKARTDAEKAQADAEKAQADAVAKSRELQTAIDNTVYLVNTIDLAELFNLRVLPVRKELLEPALKANREFLRLHGDDVEREPEAVAAAFRVAILTRLIATRPDAEPAAVPEALEVGKQALARQKKFVDSHPDVIQYKRDLAASYHNVGYLTHKLGESQEAVAYLNAARKIREELHENQPENLDYESELAGVLNDIGLAWGALAEQKDDPALYATAEQLLRKARDRQRKVSKEAPHILRYRILVATHAFNLGKLVAELGRPADALPLVEEMLTAYPDDAEVLARAARVLVLVADGMQGTPDAEAHLARAVKLTARAYLEMPDRPLMPPLKYKELLRLKDRPDFQEVVAKFAARDGTKR
jgi:tRNA A-37 threonylcarbamoyl transferase component Bud32/tetratricopeptide (TPR) repeat protein